MHIPVVLRRLLALLSLLSLGLSPGAYPALGGDDFHPPIRVGTVRDSRVTEISGMVPVSGHEGLFWIHNDSKDSARIFAVREDGDVIAQVDVAGATNTDWEDIACGPGPLEGRSYLYVADTGNNQRQRTVLSIWRFPEPELPRLVSGQRLTSAPAEEQRVRYPDGVFDAEAVVVHPETAELYVLTKASGSAGVYRLPAWAPAGVETLERLGSVSTGSRVTAVDVSQDGERLLIRTYARVIQTRLAAGQPFERIFFASQRTLPSTSVETKSESICFDHRSRDYLTTDEGSSPPIHRTYRKEAQPVCGFQLDASSPLRFVRGDVLEEMAAWARGVNAADAVRLLDALGDGPALDCADRGDADDDGELDAQDLTTLLRSLVAGSALDDPFRSRGEDPSSDDLPCFATNSRRLILRDDPWRYRYDSEPPPAEWRELGHDDSAWREGSGGIGFGSSGLGTRLPGTPSASHTLHARRAFTVERPDVFDHLVLEIDYNDGFVAYVNGVEVARRGLGGAGFTVPAGLPASSHPGGELMDIHVCPATLIAGENVLALEVHRRSGTDSSLFFRAGLRAFALAEPPPPAQPPDLPAARLVLGASRAASVGDPGVIEVRLDASRPVRGLSFSVAYDRRKLRVTRATAAAALAGQVREEFSVNPSTGRLSYVLVVDPAAAVGGAIPAGESMPVVDIHYETLSTTAPGETEVSFVERGGSVPLRALVVVDGPRSLLAETVDAILEITDLGSPLISSFLENRGPPGSVFLVIGRRFETPGLAVRVCGRPAEFDLLLDGQTLEVVAPGCEATGPAPVEVCTAGGCDAVEDGFFYEEGLRWTRGDANGDGIVDVSDPIALLGQLFLGIDASPACDEALDANADERLDLSDAIFVLGFLFGGTSAIPPPYPDPAPCP